MVPVQDCPSLFAWKIPPVKQGSVHPGPAVPRRQCYQCQDGSAISATSLRTVVPTFCFKRLAPGFRQKNFWLLYHLFWLLQYFLTPTSLCMSPALVVWTDTNCNFFRFLKIGWRKRNRREENSASLENVFVQKRSSVKKISNQVFCFFCQIQISDEIFDSVERLSGWTFIGGLHNCGLDKFVLPQTVLIKPSWRQHGKVYLKNNLFTFYLFLFSDCADTEQISEKKVSNTDTKKQLDATGIEPGWESTTRSIHY